MPEEVKPEGTPQDTPQYLTKEEFGKSAAYFRKVAEENASLKEMLSAVVEKSEDGQYKLKVATPAPAPKQDKAPEWQTELNALKSELKKRDDLIAEKDRKAAETSKRSAIVDALAKGNAVNPQRDAVHIFDTVKTNSEGKYVAYAKDENGLDVETPLETFVGNWLKSNPELVKASGKPGSGTPAGHTAGGDLNPDLASLAAMTPEQYIQHRKKNK